MEFSHQLKTISLARRQETIAENNFPHQEQCDPSQLDEEFLDHVILIKKYEKITPENLPEVIDKLGELFQCIKKIDLISRNLLLDTEVCDFLMHFLVPFHSKDLSCIVHDIFQEIFCSSEDAAAIVFNSSYFVYVCNRFFDDIPTDDKEFEMIIRSLRFGVYHFIKIDEIFFSKSYQERLQSVVESCADESNKQHIMIIHEVFLLADAIIYSKPEKNVIFFIGNFITKFINNANFVKDCFNIFIKCAKMSPEFVIFARNNNILDYCMNSIGSDGLDTSSKLKAFILIRYILGYDSYLSVQIITLDFCNHISLFLDSKPSHQEKFVYSLLQISLNDDSIPLIIYQSNIFQKILNILQNTVPSTFHVGITCRLLIASFLRNSNTDFIISIFSTSFDFLEDIFLSENGEWIIEGIDAIMIFMEHIEKSDPGIIQQITNRQWVHECLEACLTNPIERIAVTAKYLISKYNFQNHSENI